MFRDRLAAGRALASRLGEYRSSNPIVLGLPRGGVPVAAEVARALSAPLDVIVVRKLGVPGHEEYAFGAIGEDGVRILNERAVTASRLSADDIATVERRERAVLEDRVRRLRAQRPRLDLRGRVAIIVDDGLATGATARAAISVARAHGAETIVLAVPVGAPGTIAALEKIADAVVVVEAPREFGAVGQWYQHFAPVDDREVARLLDMPISGDGSTSREVSIPAGDVTLPGTLHEVPNPIGIVVFVHGSGSSRLSPRNIAVARVLQRAGCDTLLFDLLTEREAKDRRNVFDVALLASRLAAATTWVRARPEQRNQSIGYFGASTGGAAALVAAADDPDIAAVVSRGGRPDLAGTRLGSVQAPTLLIVGSRDDLVLELNHRAAKELRCVNLVRVVDGATHLFEEPGTLAEVARLASAWFARWLANGVDRDVPRARRYG